MQTQDTGRLPAAALPARAIWSFLSARVSARLIYGVAGVALLVNLVLLVYYHHYIAADFPFGDEWRYTVRLSEIPRTGFFSYLFRPDNLSYSPVQFLFWYAFYALTHLDFTIIRYVSVAISVGVSLLLVVMLGRKATSWNWTTLLALLAAPFFICSYNHSTFYNMSMAAVSGPLLIGLVVAAIWIAEQTFQIADKGAPAARVWAWGAAGVVVWLLASGVNPPGLVVVLVIAAARLLLYRRIDKSLIALAAASLVIIAAALSAGHGLSSSYGTLGNANTGADLLNAIKGVVGLTGNAILWPASPAHGAIAWILGVGILLAQLMATLFVLRAPAEQRTRFFVPVALTIFNFLVIGEIVAARLHESNFWFEPRYTLFTIGGPLSLLFFIVLLPPSVRFRLVFSAATLLMSVVGLWVAYGQTAASMPYIRRDNICSRATIMSLHGAPNSWQRKNLWLDKGAASWVYPALSFLRQNRLAMYATRSDRAIDESPPPLSVTAFGPRVYAGKPFNSQSNGESAFWIQMNRPSEGIHYVFINGVRLQADSAGSSVTLLVPPSLYRKRGTYPMYVTDVTCNGQEIRSNLVRFVVR